MFTQETSGLLDKFVLGHDFWVKKCFFSKRFTLPHLKLYLTCNFPLNEKHVISVWRVFVSLTTQADCTASDTLPALGSHQNTWHWKCWFPVSMMNANVWTSRPTPMKDRKRTRHSTMTSSSSSCPNRREMTVINLSIWCHQLWITLTGLWMFHQDPSRKKEHESHRFDFCAVNLS